MGEVIDLKNDPTEKLAQRIAERVYVALGCASVPLLKRAIADALRDDKARGKSWATNHQNNKSGKRESANRLHQ
jgi:hypothetical protein